MMQLSKFRQTNQANLTRMPYSLSVGAPEIRFLVTKNPKWIWRRFLTKQTSSSTQLVLPLTNLNLAFMKNDLIHSVNACCV